MQAQSTVVNSIPAIGCKWEDCLLGIYVNTMRSDSRSQFHLDNSNHKYGPFWSPVRCNLSIDFNILQIISMRNSKRHTAPNRLGVPSVWRNYRVNRYPKSTRLLSQNFGHRILPDFWLVLFNIKTLKYTVKKPCKIPLWMIGNKIPIILKVKLHNEWKITRKE